MFIRIIKGLLVIAASLVPLKFGFNIITVIFVLLVAVFITMPEAKASYKDKNKK